MFFSFFFNSIDRKIVLYKKFNDINDIDNDSNGEDDDDPDPYYYSIRCVIMTNCGT